MKTLYVSDLDGTLLNKSGQISAYTCRTLNRMIEKGLLFSYATARSHITSSKVTEGLRIKIPVITYNGVEILQNESWDVLQRNTFGEEKNEILNILLSYGVYPLIHTFINGEEKFSYIPEKSNGAMKKHLSSRKGDVRDHPVTSARELGEGDIFYFSCIGEGEKLSPLYAQLKDRYHCIFQQDVYSGEPWLEIIPEKVSKAQAVLCLKKIVGADRLVVFGDGLNDREMFAAADEAYAVSNAAEELIEKAAGVIGSNEEDGVARWLELHY